MPQELLPTDRRRRRPGLLAVAVVALLAAPGALAQAPLRLVYFDDFAPFSLRTDAGKMEGILVAVLDEALGKRLGVPLEHAGYPWARAQDLVREGRADGFATVSTPERRAYTVVSEEPVVVATFTLFAPVGSPSLETLREVTTVEGLRPFKIGQYLGSGWAKEKLAGMDVDWSPSLHQTLRMLASSRVDVIVGVSQVMRYNIHQLGFSEEIVEIPNVVDSHPFMLCIAKDSPWAGIVSRFDATIREMEADGTLQRLIARFD